MWLKVLLWISVLYSIVNATSVDNSFHHNVDFTTDDSGERFKLHSSGVLSNIIDLDAVKGIKRLVCVDDRILLVTNQSNVGKDWQVGQLLLASSRWRCNATEVSEGTGIYAKIVSIYFPTDRRLSLHVVPAGPYEMIEEANIHFRYSPGRGDLPPETRSRHRRYLSNILAKILGNINWQANFSTRIPFNEDNNGRLDKTFTVHKSLGEVGLKLNDSGLDVIDDFTVKCISCHGGTNMSYVFELLIKKVDNKPKLLKYISQLQASSEVSADLEVEFLQEMGVNYSRTLWETGLIELIRVPVAVVRQLPPVELSLSYSSQTLAHVHGYSRAAARARTGYTATGKYTLSQNFEESSTLQGDISSYDWTAKGDNFADMDIKDTLNITVDIYQKILFNASIAWKAKDILIDLSPPMEMTVKPTVKMETTVEGHAECVDSDLTVTGMFELEKSELKVHAFGINIWDVVLGPEERKEELLTKDKLSHSCRAHCVAPSQLGPPFSSDEVCGAMKSQAERGSAQFDMLEVLYGDEIVFLSEESENAWCGDSTTPCTSCNISINSNIDMSRVCADRIVSARLASAITKLHHLVRAEWPTVSLVVVEAWDEPTSAHPDGQHGNASLHYEGRAAAVTVTGDVNEKILQRLGSLAVCSGFEYVETDNGSMLVHVAVNVDGFTAQEEDSDKEIYDDMFSDTTINDKSEACAHSAPALSLGDTVPSGLTVEEVCGSPQGPLSRVNRRDVEKLYHYTLNDVEFLSEGASGELCGQPSRRCRSDCTHTGNQNRTEPWTWCSTRITTPRMALKLRQLAKLAAKEGLVVQVIKAFVEDDIAIDDFYKEGRALRLTVASPGSGDVGRLAVLAACSGFDYTRFRDSSFVDVYVRSNDGFLSMKAEFPDEDATRLIVSSPPHESHEYHYPEALLDEVISPPLVPGHDKDTFLSEHYQIRDILSPNRDYFRFDSSLLLCLDLVTDEYGRKVEILLGSGYRTQSVNMINFDIRHPEERFRFQTGQAVELRPPGYKGQSDLLNLVKTIFRSCTPFLREEMRGIGVGCHKDRLYVDIRPLEIGKEMEYIKVWEAEECHYYGNVRALQKELLQGGPVVASYDPTVCSRDILPSGKHYLTFQFHQQGLCSTSEQAAFCAATLPFRKEESQKLQERMTSAAGFGRLPRADIRIELDQCLVDLCGGCPGVGSIWDKKVVACSLVVDRFITRATRAFPDLIDRASFFNTETVHSSVHSLACHDGHVCIENIQLYSLFMPLVTARYRPDETGSIETMMFSSDRNPTPLLELVEQEMAYKARGKVKVFIEDKSDFKAIKSVIKVLMLYNKNITEVEFHVADDLDIDLVTADLQRNLDIWSGNTCPEVSRFAVAPFSFQTVSHVRRKRSLERSEHRNEARRKVHEWELDWMMKLL